MLGYYKKISFSLRFLRLVQGDPITKLRKTVKYTQFFSFHYDIQQRQIQSNLKNYQVIEKKSQNQNADYYKSAIKKYLNSRKQSAKQKIKDFQNTSQEEKEQFAKRIAKKVFENLSLFYESLQSLVEGRREVMQDDQFKFDDGQTVNQKRDSFEKFLQKILGKKKVTKKQQTDQKENIQQ